MAARHAQRRRPIPAKTILLEKAQSRISFSALEIFTGDYRGSPRTRITRRGRERVILLSYPATELSEESESRY